jgi:hypothetical protein
LAVRAGWIGNPAQLNIEHLQKSIDRYPVVSGDSFQDAGERSRFDRIMVGNDFVVLAVAQGCHADV